MSKIDTGNDRWEIKKCGCKGAQYSISLNNREVSSKYHTEKEAQMQLPYYKKLREEGKI